MTCNTFTWPYLTAHSGVESQEHVRLKNCAVQFLLDAGFNRANIQQEVTYDTGMTDIVASQDGIRVFVECETNSSNHLSKGGMEPFRDGECVLIVQPDGVYILESEEHETKLVGPFGKEYSSSEYGTHEVRVRRKIADVPDLNST